MTRSIAKDRRWVFGGVAGILAGVGYLAPLMGALTPMAVVIALLLGLSAAVGAARMRAIGPRHLLLTLSLSLMAAVIAAVSIPLVKDGYADVRITATGQKNSASKSSEVFVRLISGSVIGLRDFESDGWEKRGDVFVSYQNQPNVLLYRGAWSSPAALRFVRHPYSGIVEVNVAGETHRIDLFAESEAYVDVPLPEATISWKGYLQRVSIIVGLTLLFSGVGAGLVALSLFSATVYFAAVFAGCLTLWIVKDESFAGQAEIVAFAAEEAPSRVEMDAGNGFTPALVLPVKSGTSTTSSFELPNPNEWTMGIDGGSLRVFTDLDASSDPAAKAGSDNGCAISSPGRCVYEVLGTDATLWLQRGGERVPVALPPALEGSTRLFLLVERKPGRMTLSASRAAVTLSPTENFSKWIQSVRIVDAGGKPASKLVRVVSEGVEGYRVCSERTAGVFAVPQIPRSDTPSFVGMKLVAVLLSVSFVVLLAIASRIVAGLVRSYRSGLRLEVSLVAAGAFFWVCSAVMVGWPAVIEWDGFSPYMQAQSGSLTLWYGTGYPLIVGGFLLIGSGSLITVWSAVLTGTLLLAVSAGVMRCCGRKARLLVASLIVVAPPFTAIEIAMLTQVRDAMNGLLLSAFAICCFVTALNWSVLSLRIKPFCIAGLLLLGAFLALLRIDNLPTILFVGSALIWVVAQNVRGRIVVAALVWGLWISIGPVVERLVFPDAESLANEKRLYEVTAVVNPLVGMLVRGVDVMPAEEQAKLRATLDKVMDVSTAERQWSPYDIYSWHETFQTRPSPDRQTINLLRETFVRTAFAYPWVFLKIRSETFLAILGHSWPGELGPIGPSAHKWILNFYDHLQTEVPRWKQVVEVFGFSPNPHLHPQALKRLQDWSSSIASTVLPLLLCLAVAMGMHRHPFASVIAVGELMRAGVFFLLAPASVFLYLYDVHLLGFLLPLMAVTELATRSARNLKEGAP